MAMFCGSNLAAVSNFGEFEFWFAALKIGAIGLFLGLGVLPGTANLLHDGGFLPNGVDGPLVGLLASVVAYSGLETVTIAAAESDNPVRGVTKAVKTTMWRIGLVYVGSMLVIVTLLPWNDPAVTTTGPYAATLDHLLPHALKA